MKRASATRRVGRAQPLTPHRTPSLLVLLVLAGCGNNDPGSGDCGSILASGECVIARSQLGHLEDHPPGDPSNRFGQCGVAGSSQCVNEDRAAVLGQRLFFDRCLSIAHDTACVTCHEPASAFIDPRSRLIQSLPSTYMVDGMPVTLALPLLQKQNPDGTLAPLTPDLVTSPPPAVQAQLDANGVPLAHWNGQSWVAVTRRPQASYGSTAPAKVQVATARHSPSLYNIAYGSVVPSSDGGRTAGVIWGPWDGRYDSHWSLVANVMEFGATQNTDRAHIALRIYLKHRKAYEDMIGGPLSNFQAVDMDSGKFVYPRHGSPNVPTTCWFNPVGCNDTAALAPTAAVRGQINEVFVNAGKALSAYMRRLRSNNSPYDKWVAGDTTAMSSAAQRGLRLFVGKAECILCHNGPNFTDSQFHNLGVPTVDAEGRIAGSAPVTTLADAKAACFPGLAPNTFCPDPGRNGWQVRAAGQCRVDSAPVGGKTATCQRVAWPDTAGRFDVAMDCRSAASDATDKEGDSQCLPAALVSVKKCAYAIPDQCRADRLCQWIDQAPARCVAIDNSDELGQFKTPTLRNVALTFPYMHNGALFDYDPAETGMTTSDDPRPHLRRVVRFYAGGGGTPLVGRLAPQIRKLNLSEPDIDDLIEFLLALTDNSLTTDNRDGLAQLPIDLQDLSDCPQ